MEVNGQRLKLADKVPWRITWCKNKLHLQIKWKPQNSEDKKLK